LVEHKQRPLLSSTLLFAYVVTVQPLFLTFALLLLWFPRGWLRHGARVTSSRALRSAEVAARVERDPHDRSVKPLAEAAKSRNWVDLFRGVVGAYGITAVAILPPVGLVGVHGPTVALQGVVMVAGVCFQMLRLEGRLSLFAPVFYLQGVTFGVAGLQVGLLAMVGSWALSPVLPGAGAILFVQGGLALSLGLMMQSAEPTLLMVTTGVVWLPVLGSVLLRKRLSASLDKRVKMVSRGAVGTRGEAREETVGRDAA
jgi:hypothetical protein